jgi:ABC-type transport system involved in multi-copper enzyme maturation permease subunit
MSSTIVKQLVFKDWYLQRWPIAGYLAGAVVALLFLGTGSTGSFYAGTIVLITLLIGAGIQLVLSTVVNERTEQTLPFMMTLPVSNHQYTAAKVTANLTMFLLLWSALTAGTLAVLNGRSAETRALIPMATLTLFELLAAYTLLLFVALVTESQTWTISVMVGANLGLQAWFYYISRIPGIAHGLKTHRLEWSPGSLLLLYVEIALIILLLALSFVFRARKTDFL